MSLKNERDSTIQKLFSMHNLGSLPTPPFSEDIALKLANRVRSRLLDLEQDLQEKKVYILTIAKFFSLGCMLLYFYCVVLFC